MKAMASLASLVLFLSITANTQAENQVLKVTASGEGSCGSNMTQEQVKQIAADSGH